MQFSYLLCFVLASVTLMAGCDGSSGSSRRNTDSAPGQIDSPPASQPPADTTPTPSGLLTGHLVDAAVAGVSYTRPDRSGITGSEGDFEYLEGETIRFSIGDTELGTAIGANQITPFELAASPVVTETPHIRRALNRDSDPFHKVLNMALLLQSLDRDGDPANGIEITAATSALLQGEQLDLSQNWRTFVDDPVLRRVLGQATQRSLIAGPETGILPATALQHLHDELGLDASTLAVSLAQRPGREATGYEYNSAGYLTRVSRPHWYNEGDEVTDYLTQAFNYDERGRLTRFEENWYQETEFDFDGSILFTEERLETFVETRDWNEQNQLSRLEASRGSTVVQHSQNEPSAVSEEPLRIVEQWLYDYDADHRLRQVTSNFMPVSQGADAVTTYQYTDAGQLARIDFEGTHLPDVVRTLDLPSMDSLYMAGIAHATYSVIYEYSAAGTLLSELRDGERPDLGRSIETRIYNQQGRVERLEMENRLYGDSPESFQGGLSVRQYEYDAMGNVTRERIDFGGDGSVDEINKWGYRYDEQGRMLYREVDLRGYGSLEEVTRWTYDKNGRLILIEHDHSADGVIDSVLRWEYDEDGYLLSENDDGDTLNYQYAPAGWGHIFAEAPPRNPLRIRD